MEYIPHTLDKIIQLAKHCDGGGMPIQVIGRIAHSILETLHLAWTRYNVMHRDLKPNNILITSRGQVKLCDFNLAKIFGTDTKLLDLSSNPGALQYQAPERMEEATKNCYNHKADVWSAGLTIWVMANRGRYPFKGLIFDICKQIMDKEKVDKFRLNPELGYPQELQDFFDAWYEPFPYFDLCLNSFSFFSPSQVWLKISMFARIIHNCWPCPL